MSSNKGLNHDVDWSFDMNKTKQWQKVSNQASQSRLRRLAAVVTFSGENKHDWQSIAKEVWKIPQ